MDPLSVTAGVIACYQLASAVGALSIRYVKGVRDAGRDGDFVIAQIETFIKQLLHLQKMVMDETSSQGTGSRLKLLENMIDGHSASLKVCSQELEKIKAKLEKAHSERGFKIVVHRLSWPLKQEEVNQAMATLASFGDAIERALSIETNEVVRGMDTTTKGIETATKHILLSSQNAGTRQREEETRRKDEEERREAEGRREKILTWLSHPNPSESHNNISSARKSGDTGRWFLDGTIFQKFKTCAKSVLWLHGDSGCGKSVLCSAVIDELQAVKQSKSPQPLAYWYFSVNDTKRRSLQNFMRAFMTQLIPRNRAFPLL